ncbi:MAG: LysR family transcriptional regulator [Caldimonas sp.]
MNLHRLDLVSLALFRLVSRTGSISKGAELAHLALTAASKRISDLEEAVGAPLLERHSRGVTLTLAGQALQRHAQRILADVDELAAELSDHAKGIVGVVKLWANTSAVTQFLPVELAGFVGEHPGIRIALDESNSREAVLAVLDGRADLGIFAERTPLLGVEAMHYRLDRLVLVVPAAHPLATRGQVAFAEATEYEFVSLSQGTSLAERLALEAQNLGRPLRLRIQVRSFDAMCRMVAAGLGLAVLPDAAVRPHLHSMGLRRIALTDPWVERELLIGMRDRRALSRPARLLLEHLVAGSAAPASNDAA